MLSALEMVLIQYLECYISAIIIKLLLLFISDCYLILTYIVLVSYFAFFDISTVNCHLLLCELSFTIVWNIYILCHIYHFHEKFQYVVQFSIFILKILLTYVNTS